MARPTIKVNQPKKKPETSAAGEKRNRPVLKPKNDGQMRVGNDTWVDANKYPTKPSGRPRLQPSGKPVINASWGWDKNKPQGGTAKSQSLSPRPKMDTKNPTRPIGLAGGGVLASSAGPAGYKPRTRTAPAAPAAGLGGKVSQSAGPARSKPMTKVNAGAGRPEGPGISRNPTKQTRGSSSAKQRPVTASPPPRGSAARDLAAAGNNRRTAVQRKKDYGKNLGKDIGYPPSKYVGAAKRKVADARYRRTEFKGGFKRLP